MASVKPTVALIDGNNLCYRMFYAHRYLCTEATAFPTGVLHGVFTSMQYFMRHFECTPVFVFDGALAEDGFPSWRHRAFKRTYKAHRRKPEDIDNLYKQFPALTSMLKYAGYCYVGVRGVEADDLIAILAKYLNRQGRPLLVLSSDRDLLQLTAIADVVRPTSKDDYEINGMGCPIQIGNIVLKDVAEFLAFRSLVGDTSDGLPGIPGIGPVKAFKLLQQGFSPLTEYDSLPEACKSVLTLKDFKKARYTYALSMLMANEKHKVYTSENRQRISSVVKRVLAYVSSTPKVDEKEFLAICYRYELSTVANIRKGIYRHI